MCKSFMILMMCLYVRACVSLYVCVSGMCLCVISFCVTTVCTCVISVHLSYHCMCVFVCYVFVLAVTLSTLSCSSARWTELGSQLFVRQVSGIR